MLSGTYPSYGQTTLEGIMLPMTTGSLSVAKQKQKLFSIIIATMQVHTHTDGHTVHIATYNYIDTMCVHTCRHIHTHRQTDIYTYTDRQHIHTHRHTYIHTYIQTDRQTYIPYLSV